MQVTLAGIPADRVTDDIIERRLYSRDLAPVPAILSRPFFRTLPDAIVRPGNADLNGTLALAVVSTICWLYFILRYAGIGFVMKDLFGNKADRREVPAYIYFPLFLVFFAVGLIEVISIMVRPISLSLRLFGNVFGGENLLHSMSEITRWGLPIPFYFLELLIGFVQALVFVLLVSVYIGLICNHGDDHDTASGHGPAH